MFGRPENFKSCRESSGEGFAAQLRYIGKAYIGCANDAGVPVQDPKMTSLPQKSRNSPKAGTGNTAFIHPNK